jgi:hypothetical protein
VVGLVELAAGDRGGAGVDRAVGGIEAWGRGARGRRRPSARPRPWPRAWWGPDRRWRRRGRRRRLSRGTWPRGQGRRRGRAGGRRASNRRRRGRGSGAGVGMGWSSSGLAVRLAGLGCWLHGLAGFLGSDFAGGLTCWRAAWGRAFWGPASVGSGLLALGSGLLGVGLCGDGLAGLGMAGLRRRGRRGWARAKRECERKRQVAGRWGDGARGAARGRHRTTNRWAGAMVRCGLAVLLVAPSTESCMTRFHRLVAALALVAVICSGWLQGRRGRSCARAVRPLSRRLWTPPVAPVVVVDAPPVQTKPPVGGRDRRGGDLHAGDAASRCVPASTSRCAGRSRTRPSKTYGNKCTACSDAKVVRYVDGKCGPG